MQYNQIKKFFAIFHSMNEFDFNIEENSWEACRLSYNGNM